MGILNYSPRSGPNLLGMSCKLFNLPTSPFQGDFFIFSATFLAELFYHLEASNKGELGPHFFSNGFKTAAGRGALFSFQGEIYIYIPDASIVYFWFIYFVHQSLQKEALNVENS